MTTKEGTISRVEPLSVQIVGNGPEPEIVDVRLHPDLPIESVTLGAQCWIARDEGGWYIMQITKEPLQ